MSEKAAQPFDWNDALGDVELDPAYEGTGEEYQRAMQPIVDDIKRLDRDISDLAEYRVAKQLNDRLNELVSERDACYVEMRRFGDES